MQTVKKAPHVGYSGLLIVLKRTRSLIANLSSDLKRDLLLHGGMLIPNPTVTNLP